MQRFESTTVPCQYWYDNKWYDLTNVSSDTGFIMSTPNGAAAGSQPYAAYNFCRKVNQASSYKDLNCNEAATNAFATIVGVPTSECSAASTDSYTSIASTSFTEANGDNTLAL